MPTQSRTRITPVILSGELTDAQRAIADQPVPSDGHVSTQRESRPSPDHETITKLAYELYQQEGCIEGRALDHWLEAERRVL